ncbi:Cocaine esterase [Colletotrichum fructicola]|uniref:X-pro dipeptidyl-peptidase c-terminal non-catalytic domain-containing protein n=1 Tax=Colletotrichum fructicola (strain Nara gc5) TaxID=1213859 RepID=L2FAW2_COLFN|nr:Cocaine esterase [Colletotrichum fructicola]KAF4906851.1 Cocaine esterase [Colletotrichum fructicola]KAF4936116.1 Cocaine esterase [Colletotrichum fructicola]
MDSKLVINGYNVPLCDTIPPENEDNCFPYSFKERRKELLPMGWRKTPRSRPLLSEIIYEVNEEMKHSDGVKIYYDVCRPNISEKVPALLALSPYGKGGHGFHNYDLMPYRVGVKEEMLSGLEKFESVDPAEWVPRGYAIISVDVRGSWDSEGDLFIEGTGAGRDGAEIVEHIASLPWCSGSVGMQGNSWLAQVQWSTASLCPPSLKAIAPWEGFTDKYRDVLCRGGIPDATFDNLLYRATVRGRLRREDVAKAIDKWPLMNPYWEDKIPQIENIDIPMYVVAGYSSSIHSYGTIQGFRTAKSKQKWLRVHCTQEWFDIYRPDMTDELQAFFDRYLKGIENDWEKTNPVRVSILTFGNRFGPKPIEHFPMGSYPHEKTEYKKLYLTENKLSLYYPEATGVASYESDDANATTADFLFTFPNTTTLMGFTKAKLWVSCNDSDDMDIYVSLRKVNKSGKVLEHINIPWTAIPQSHSYQEDVVGSNIIKFTGCHGMLRVSHRATDRSKQNSIMPYHPHKEVQKVPPGEIVPIEVGLWPIGMQFYEGERLLFRVGGSKDAYLEIPDMQTPSVYGINKGKHHIHFGGKFNSYVVVPVIPTV